MTALAALRKLLCSSRYNWTSSGQHEAVKCSIKGNSDLLVALPTGSGKSIIPIVAAMVTKKTFVVVVPLILLLEDWERRLRKTRI